MDHTSAQDEPSSGPDVDGVAALSEALGRRHAIAALGVLLNDGPMGATALTYALKAAAGGGLAVAKHLQAHGLVRLHQRPGVARKPSYVIELTAPGRRLATALVSLARARP